MLGELERKLTALVGDLLAQRTDVKVLAAADPSTPGTGEGTVHVALSDLSACAVFEHGQFAAAGTGNSPARRRIQPLQFAARLEFNRNPQGSSPAARSTARGRLLDDLSLVSHGLGTLALRTGAAFATDNPDPGFRVVAFELESGVTAVTPAGSAANPLAAELIYRGQVEIWPPGVTEPEGVMRAVDVLVEAQPVEITVVPPVLRAGATATLTMRVPGGRLIDALGAHGSLSFVLAVRSDAPPAERGAVTSGNPGPETGTRLVPAAEPETVVQYQAPAAAADRPRIEHILVYLARPDGGRGTFLGAAAVQIVPGGP